MTGSTFTCDRCGKQATNSYAATSIIHRALCLDCVHAVRRDIDQFAGEGAPSQRDAVADGSGASEPDGSPGVRSPHAPSPVPDSRPVDLASDDRSVDFTVKGDSVKMLRETFCVAQTSILRDREVDPDWFRQIHVDRLQRLLEICDEHRPLDPDGKHGTRRCTLTCGCENKPHGIAEPDRRLIPLPGGRIAVAAQDLQVGDVVGGWNVREVQKDDGVLWVALASRGITADTSYADGTLVLLDKAAES